MSWCCARHQSGTSNYCLQLKALLLWLACTLFQADGSHESYAGALKATPLREFLDAYATKEAQPMNSGAADADRASPERMGEVQLHSLDAGNLTDIVGHADMWLLAFYKAQGRNGVWGRWRGHTAQ